MREIRRKGQRKGGTKVTERVGQGAWEIIRKKRSCHNLTHTYIRKHTHVHIEYTLNVSESKVHLSVEIFCV